MSGTLGGVDASIPLRAGAGTGQTANSLTNNPLAFIDALTRMKTLQLLPGQLQLQQQELQSGQQSIQSNAVKLGQQKTAAAANYLRTLFGQPIVSHDDVVRALGAAHGVPGVDTDGLIGRLAEYNAPNGNYAGFVRDQILPTMSEQGALTALTPTPANIEAGGNIIIGTRAPLASGQPGQFVSQGTVPVTLTPGQKVAQLPTVATTPEGPQAGNVSVGTRYDNEGNLRDAKGNIVRSGAENAGDLTGALPNGFLPSQAPMGVSTAIEESTKRFQGISDAAVQARSQQALLQNVQNEVQNYTPGKGADVIKDFRQIIMRVAPGLVDQKALASQESVDKIANQLADALGAGSDARMHVQQGANPSSHNTPQGIQLILNQLLGIGDYAQARAALAAKQPGTGNIRQFEASVGSQLDPRVFQYDRLTPEQAREYLANVSDLPTFIKRYDWAKGQGLLASQR